MTAPKRFDGLTILVVEDETIVSSLIEDFLTELGCSKVISARDVKGALALLKESQPDAAVLDVNLAGELVYPVAEALDAARIPFIFSTGYGGIGIPQPWASRRAIQKPFKPDALAEALYAAL